MDRWHYTSLSELMTRPRPFETTDQTPDPEPMPGVVGSDKYGTGDGSDMLATDDMLEADVYVLITYHTRATEAMCDISYIRFWRVYCGFSCSQFSVAPY